MAQIYNHDTKKLYDLLERAGVNGSATLIIPDLQRPYVWKPSQVTLLVDSLLRGWPFGTLLLWQAHEDDLAQIPARTFWKVVDLTDDDAGNSVTRQNPPGGFQMVLDGQQRLQSLLLALGDDGWGFKLYDRVWSEDLLDKRVRGRHGLPHWSVGNLCFDLLEFERQYKQTNNILEINFRDALRWVICDSANGQSKLKPADIHQSPLPRAFDPTNRGRFVRFSRLWKLALPNTSVKEAAYRHLLSPFLAEQHVEGDVADALLAPLAELMTTLSEVKVNEVAYLEVTRFNPQIWLQDVYSDAVVNIFTRLNTAGRVLTREEITFAWLKVGWNNTATGGCTASVCFGDLLDKLRSLHLILATDDLVSAASLIWSAVFGAGAPLSNKDLLKGDTVRPMAQQFSEHWEFFTDSALRVALLLKNRDLLYGEIFQSVNSLSILWGVAFLGVKWAGLGGSKVVEGDSFDKQLAVVLSSFADRWLICSQWAKRWAEASGATVGKYVKDLAGLSTKITPLTNPAEVIAALQEQVTLWNTELERDALAFVAELQVTKREKVSTYFVPLWVWHRLEAKRWEMSAIPLRENRHKKMDHEVDHIVAVGLWDEKLGSEQPASTTEEAADLAEIVNLLGNTFLLEKSFNISKGKQSLGQFLAAVHEFASSTVDLAAWGAALSLNLDQIDSDKATLVRLRQLIEERTQFIKLDLERFVRGVALRVDVR